MVKAKNLSYEIKNKIAYVGFGYGDEKSMTTLSKDSLMELKDIVEEIHKKSTKEVAALIFFTHKENCFLAGADIKMIDGIKTEQDGVKGAESGQKIYNLIEDLKIPTVACVHGVCLGGGTELALSCRHIIVSDSPKTILGLPEVKLGILPGFGGTYRMPQRVPLHVALDLILAGKHVNGKKAVKLGLADEMYPKEKLLEMAETLFSKPKQFKQKSGLKASLEHMAKDNFITRKIIFQKARESVLKLTKGHYQAPLKILDVMEEGSGRGRESYLSMEAQAFGELCASEQSRNLRHVFFMMEGAKRYTGPAADAAKTPKLKRGAVLGAGIMGGGIAWLMAENKMMPMMKDLNLKAIELGLKQSGDNFFKSHIKKKLTRDEMERRQRSIYPQMDFKGFKSADLIIEAIVENIDIKKKVFSEAENYVRDDAILASNTSSLSVSQMSTALKRPERFAGLHFFNPVNKMPLVEIITHDKVAPEVVKALYDWVVSTKKTPVIVKNGPGFLVNRMLCPYMNEAAYLLAEGVPLKQIEDASLNFGMPMGPFRLMDEVGLDTLVKVGKILEEGLGDRTRACNLSEKVVELNYLGKKNNRGFYRYTEKGKEDGFNEELLAALKLPRIDLTEQKIQQRLFMPMINEASYILEEKIVENPIDVDLGMIFGTGFPPFRGGPLKYADSKGIDFILKVLQELQNEVSQARYAPSNFLLKMQKEKKKFYEYA